MNNKFSLYNAHPLRITIMLISYIVSFTVLLFMGRNRFNLAIVICSLIMVILSTLLARMLLYMQIIFEDNAIIIKSFRKTIVIEKKQIKYIEFLKSDSAYSRVQELSPYYPNYQKKLMWATPFIIISTVKQSYTPFSSKYRNYPATKEYVALPYSKKLKPFLDEISKNLI